MNRRQATSAVAVIVLCLLTASNVCRAQGAKKPARRPANRAFAAPKDDPKLPRVLLLGDSISIGYTVPVREALAGKANVHRPAANCGPTSRGVESIDAWLGDGRWDVIHFNWGLHDLKKIEGKHQVPIDQYEKDVIHFNWGLHDLKKIEGKHQVPIDQYEKNLTQLVERLKKTGAKLIWCATTPVPEGCSPPRTNDDVVAYNAVAKKIMDAEKIPIDDLYAFALPQLDKIQRPANVHFTPEGSKVLAEQVAKSMLTALGKEEKR